MTVVDLLRKLEPALWEPAVEKFRSVTTWATIRNKSGFVTAEMQKLRTNWNQQQAQQHALQKEHSSSGSSPQAESSVGASSSVGNSDMPMMPSALSPGASQHGNGRNTWAAAVRPGETRAQGGEHEPSPPQVAVGSDYPAHALVTRLSKELAAIPGGKNTRRERKRLTQRLYDAERTDAYVAESAAMAAAAATSAGGATNGGLATHLRACVRAQYGARTNAVTSRFVTLALDGQNGGQSPPIGVVRPLLYDGSLLTIVRHPAPLPHAERIARARAWWRFGPPALDLIT
jgi:hypothetical protein